MQSINVYKQANGFSYKVTFAPGATSWNIIPEHTGQLVRAVMTNASAFTINGEVATFPFGVTAGTSIAVQVTAIDAAQPASIEFFADDINAAAITVNAANFSTGNGRYLYALHQTENKLSVLDTELLKPANYLGAGSWSTNPVISLIDLPVLPTAGGTTAPGKWANGIYDPIDNSYILIGNCITNAGSPTTHPIFLSKIYCSGANQHQLYDITGTTAGGYKQVNMNDTMGSYSFGVHLDYVNNRLNLYIAGNRPRFYDLNTKPVTTDNSANYNMAYATKFFEPTRKVFIAQMSIWDYWASRSYMVFGQGANGSRVQPVYDSVADCIYWADSHHMNKINMNGATLAGFYNIANFSGSYAQMAVLAPARRMVMFSARSMGFSVSNLTNFTQFGAANVPDVAASQTRLCADSYLGVTSSNYAERAYCVGGNGDGVKRISIINPMLASNNYEGYFVSPYQIHVLDSNQVYGR